MSWFTHALERATGLEAEALADHVARTRQARGLDSYESWILDPRPLTFGEYLLRYGTPPALAGAWGFQVQPGAGVPDSEPDRLGAPLRAESRPAGAVTLA